MVQVMAKNHFGVSNWCPQQGINHGGVPRNGFALALAMALAMALDMVLAMAQTMALAMALAMAFAMAHGP